MVGGDVLHELPDHPDRASAFRCGVCGDRKRVHLSLPEMKVARHAGCP